VDDLLTGGSKCDVGNRRFLLRDVHECSALAEIKELRLAPRPVAMAPHNSQARKNAPNKSNDGAPLADMGSRSSFPSRWSNVTSALRSRSRRRHEKGHREVR